MNLEQSPNVVDYVSSALPCLVRRGTYYCDTKARWLLPMEKFGVHLLPTRQLGFVMF